MSKPTFRINQPTANKKSRKWLIVVVIVTVLFAAGAGYAYWHKQQTDKEAQAAAEQKAQDEAQTQSAKKQEIDSDTDKTNSSSDDTISPSNGTVSGNAAITIDSITQADGIVTANATITGASGSGGCIFRFSTPNANAVVRSINSSASGNNQTCSVTAPEVEFSKVGTWNLIATFTIGDKTLEATKSVTIN